jgi:predicted GNAT family acetyltransferase
MGHTLGGEGGMTNKWPHLDYLGWRETCSALHLYLQVAGKYRLAHTPWLNHSWNATFYVTPNGLASSPIPDGPGIEVLFNLREHMVVGTCGDGRKASFALEPMTVAAFHASFLELISELGGTPTFNGQPNEVPNPLPFAEDHLFWGALDLAVTRFSGRRAPLHPGGIPALPDDVAQEAYDREVSSAGFWPGGGVIDYPAFYAYAYPAPNGYRAATVRPNAAFWHDGLSEFILPYDAVRSAADPDETLMAFLVSTYEAAAELGGWDRDLLECAPGRPRRVRRPDAALAKDAPSAGDEKVEREDGASKGRYRLIINGIEAEMTYSRAGKGLIIIDHTEVPAALRGRKVGERLVRQAVEDARRDGVAIMPLCPFAKAQIGRHPEWQDVLRRS